MKTKKRLAPNIITYIEAMKDMTEKLLDDSKDSTGSIRNMIKFYDWILKTGCAYKIKNVELPDKEQLDEMVDSGMFEVKQCFWNSIKLWMHSKKKFRYIEGYYCTLLTTHHAFCVKGEQVYDPSLENLIKLNKSSHTEKDRETTEYFGIEIPDDFLEKKFKQMLKDGWIGEILPDYFKEVILPTLPQGKIYIGIVNAYK